MQLISLSLEPMTHNDRKSFGRLDLLFYFVNGFQFIDLLNIFTQRSAC
jgi:hypothetical protein